MARGTAPGTGLRIVALALLATAVLALAAQSVGPAAAQWFDDRFPFRQQQQQQQQQRGGSWFTPFGQPQAEQPKPQIDYSRAPAPKKLDTVPQTSVVVMGDSMADWLAFGLEVAAAESPDIGILRKHKTQSALIRAEVRSDPRGDHPDWPQAARDILNAETAQYVVFMIGLNDRKSIRERVVARAATPAADAAKPGQTPPPSVAAKPADKPTVDDDPEQAPGTPSLIAPEPEPAAPTPSPAGTASYEFRSEKWVELYSRRIDETIAALKSKNVPVFWVGLPPIRGTRASSDATFLNDLYKSRAEKAGIIYVDVWDGFVDDAGRFANFGPDFEGQRRRLRTDDGVYFTRAGARKLAHYVEREIQRAMVARVTPVALPAPEEPTPQAPVAGRNAGPAATARPLAGPVMPLTAARDSDELLGAGPPRQTIADAVASRVLVKGEPVAAPAGRSDDFVWPRRGVAPQGADPLVATTTVPMTPMQPEKVETVAAPAGDAARTRAAAAVPGQPGQPAQQARAPRPPGAVGQQQAQRDPRRYQQPERPAFHFPFFSRW